MRGLRRLSQPPPPPLPLAGERSKKSNGFESSLSKLNKHYGVAASRGEGRRPRNRRQGVRGPCRPVGLRQVDHLAHDRGAGRHHGRRDPDRRQVVNDLPPRDRDVAMVFQNYALYQHMTVYDNLAFGLRNKKVPESEIKAGDRPRRRDPRPARAAEAQAAPALGRPAAARGARPLHRAQSAGLPVRRAAVQPRRQAARPDAHRDQAAARPGADDLGLRHPRPGRGDDAGRPHRGDARRPGPAGRHAAASTASR